MRQESTLNHSARPSTNGSSQNGSSPHTNGSSVKNGLSETNGYHTNGHTAVRDGRPFHGHNREEVTRILLQSLNDLGYSGAAEKLCEDSGFELELPSVAAFRRAVLGGEWEEAEALLFGEEEDADGGVVLGSRRHSSSTWRRRRGGEVDGRNGFARHGLPLKTGADTTMLRFLLRQQKYLELLESRDLNAALAVLRNELTPLKRDVIRLHTLSGLMMCQSAQDLRSQADWDGAAGKSRHSLLSEISKCISPSVMIPEHRLATLLTEVQQQQIANCRYHNTLTQPSLYLDHVCSPDDFPLQTLTELRSHADEVWVVSFSHDGSMFATAGKDGLVCIYDTERWKIRHEFREHERAATGADAKGVTCVAFSPNDEYLISCSQNNEFVVISLRDGRRVAAVDHFDYPVTSAAWLPDSQTFVVGSQSSRRPLGLYSLRAASNGTSITRVTELHSFRFPAWDSNARDNQPSFRTGDCAVSPDGTRLLASTLENKILLIDLPSRQKIDEWQMEDRVTSVRFSASGDEILVSLNEGRVWEINVETGEVVRRFEGVVQREFVVRSGFGGAGEGFVVSGSEDSRVYIWRRQTGALVARLEGHGPGTINSVAWHPTNPAVLASAGDDRRMVLRLSNPSTVIIESGRWAGRIEIESESRGVWEQ